MTPPISSGTSMLPELARSPSLVIIDKPAGLPVHAGPGGAASVETYFASLTRKRHGPWLAHRLDADTAGCLAIALTKTALIAAQAAFAAGTAQKTYWAVVAGQPAAPSGTINAPLRKKIGASGWRMEIDAGGDPAVSEYHTLGTSGGISLLAVRTRTGRTHQVRVHCAALGCPIVNDAVYGSAGGTLALLARFLSLPLAPRIAATAPLPPHMHALLAPHPALLAAAAAA